MNLTPTQADRAIGALLASAAGDALGAGYEFGPPLPDDQPVHMAGGGSFGWEPGEWTDDTSMAVPIAQVLADGGSLDDEASLDRVVAAWAGWARTAKDVGVQTRTLLTTLRTPTAAAARASAAAFYAANPRGAGGNGTLMRTGPVALGYLDDGQEAALVSAARAVSDITHADPDAGDACVLWSTAIRHAVRESDIDLTAQLVWLPEERRDRWAALIAEAEASQPADFDKNGWVVQALQGAWSAIHHGTGLVDVLERAVRGGRDTDTVAAIAGALAGAAHGAGAVPDAWREKLHGWPGLDADGLADLAVRAVGHGAAGRPDQPGTAG
ncbi:ADP-ribosylglycohydrolase family protein [Cellulomonas sp. zg-ZUI199]|uniref:ADP-ribosylglycohydrolase family protein n=1 Tax=Cellulomonas wangleii TaxID=2816956 RepID=A0ABX8D3P6_9CELL|nr:MULTISPECIES: ADP-ribosylglycohydrolase family protein [Cellulomonas]MBO0898946.1 ADP-ribosylglycohydrolase family protein [Cellulomonas sp. zg-ZUI22]MBO0923767.1 ADP-ribosylglycohydrolase family protein [Cellulomonas wangleii]MBO0924049.1 ADP-ribosylglycohydrolase family protein [Cellulomonas wangleii]QVI62075.1 ADP-ribosylglycohydrolase family protein [Cellulomonas wangleii]